MTETQAQAKVVSINPRSMRETPLCELCFEDALKVGARKSGELKSTDFKETSIRFCIGGLYKWYKSYAKHYGDSSVYAMIRDVGWYWSSFCGTDDTLSSLVREYYSLLKDITENTAYTDLAERMDELARIEKVERSSYPFSIALPFECHGVIADCAVALGMSFSVFYQLGAAKALSSNRQGLYSDWSARVVHPLFDEVMARGKSRLESFAEIKNTVDFRMVRKILSVDIKGKK